MFFPISSYKLFNQFFIVPEFLKTLSLSSSYQLFYGEISKLINHPQNRSKGFVAISREDLAAILHCSTRTIDRMISISKLNGLMLITTNGRNLLISICYHPAGPYANLYAKISLVAYSIFVISLDLLCKSLIFDF